MVATRRQGCYSIEYPHPNDSELRMAMDFDWNLAAGSRRNVWTCSESSTGVSNWRTLTRVPRYGYEVLLDHFGLTEDDVAVDSIVRINPSPADLVRVRRKKECRYDLPHKVIKNMRVGCPEGELADNFEAEQ